MIIAKNSLPIAELVPHVPEGKRKLGVLKGQTEVPDELFEQDLEIEEMFN